MNDFNGDVMEIKGMDQARQEQEARLKAFLEQSPDKVLEEIHDACHATDIVVAGYDNADTLSAGDSIAMLAVLRLRDVLECVSLWLEMRFVPGHQAGQTVGEEDL